MPDLEDHPINECDDRSCCTPISEIRKMQGREPDPWADQPWARPAPGEPTDGGCE